MPGVYRGEGVGGSRGRYIVGGVGGEIRDDE